MHDDVKITTDIYKTVDVSGSLANYYLLLRTYFRK